MSHTKGPWKLGINGVMNGENGVIAAMPYPFNPDTRWGQDEIGDNARLIAAAPDMLEALERIAGAMKPDRESLGDHYDAEYSRILDGIEAVIRKAKGEQ